MTITNQPQWSLGRGNAVVPSRWQATSPARCAPRPSAKHPQSLRDRLDERDITDLITAYRQGATATSLAAGHGLILPIECQGDFCTSPVST